LDWLLVTRMKIHGEILTKQMHVLIYFEKERIQE
jgi:hypothetical protein